MTSPVPLSRVYSPVRLSTNGVPRVTEHSDRALAERVRACLVEDMRLAGQAIVVTVNMGYVVLEGTVNGEYSRELALQLARGIAGVKGEVQDRLKVVV